MWLAAVPVMLAACVGSVLAQGPDDYALGEGLPTPPSRRPQVSPAPGDLRSDQWLGRDTGRSALPDDPAYVPTGEPVYSAPDPAAPAADLQARVADLEAKLEAAAKKETADKKKAAGHPSVKVGGRIQADWALFGQGAASRGVYGDVQDGMEFRRARMFIAGEAFNVVDYRIQMDFADTDTGAGGTEEVYDGAGNQVVDANGNPVEVVTSTKTIQSVAFKDVYITIKELPYVGHVRVGHFKEPFGLEYHTSTCFLTFMERSLGDEHAFVPARRMGVMAFDTYAGERGTWAIGAFRAEQTNGSEPPFRMDDDGGTAMTMRATFLPWYDEASGGRGLLHAGIGYSYRDVDDGTVRLRARPEAHLAPYVVDTGNIGAPVGTLGYVPDQQLLGLEAAFVYGPFSIQSEYYASWVPRHGIGVAYLNGYYVYASYFLTGEHRPYKKSAGGFDRVKPFEPFFRVRTGRGVRTGWGAWEVAYRYSHIDLVDLPVGVDGGLAHDHTLGLNWYLNPYTRIMWNYVLCTSTNDYADNPITDMSIFEMRCMIDF